MDKYLFDYLSTAVFTFAYKCGGAKKETVISFQVPESGKDYVYVVDGEVIDEPFDSSDYCSCFCWDDLASCLAQHFIKDSESSIEVHIEVEDSGYDGSTKLKSDGTQIQEDAEYKLIVYPKTNYYVMDYIGIESEDDIEQIMEWMDNEDEDGELYDYCFEHTDETVSYLSLFGDEESEVLDYEIYNENNDIVDSGVIQLAENNVFKYSGGKPFLNMAVEDAKDAYIFLHVDIAKNPSCSYDIPKNFNPEEIHWLDGDVYKGTALPIYEIEDYGDTVMPLYGAHYHGVDLPCDENDNGTYGDNRYYLFKRNDKGKYDLLRSFEG